MKIKTLAFLLLAVFAFTSLAVAQSRDTGAVTGVVKDEQGNALPGVNVSLSGANLMGERAFVTDADGNFRFPALPPGTYNLRFELPGFGTVVRENIRVNTTITLTLDIEMRPAAVSEEITVQAQVPTIDVKSTETASVTLSNEILRNIPYNQFTADIVNLAPGVNDNSAYGASVNTGIAYTMDGVNVADPEAGSAWVFSDHNIIEEAKVMGIALPAEYGNFTGVIFNLVTKSGGNEFSGHTELNFQGYREDSEFWQAVNNEAYAEDFPLLTSPSSKLFDINAHLGGPILRDKLWFYAGGQFYRTQNRPTGFPEDVDYKQPRLFIKLTSQLTPTLNVNGAFQTTSYNGINRDSGATVSPEATVEQTSPDILASFSLTQILSPKTFFDVKGAYFEGYYYLDPETGMDPYMRYLGDEEFVRRYDSAGYFYYADRARFQANASLTHYVEDFIQGDHDFKFGAEIERSSVRNRYGYTGRGGALGDAVKYYLYDDPYYNIAYQYEGYDTNTRYTRLELFAQDSWQITNRLNLSLGARFSNNWGQAKDVDGNVYTSTRLAPRLGFAFDLLGDKSTILKGHYGQFTEAMLSSYHDRMNPDSAYSDWVLYYFDTEINDWYESYRVVHESLYTMDPDIKHPYMQQFTLSLERDLFRDTSVSVTYIHRDWKNIIGPVDRAADYEQVDVTVPDTGETFRVYERTEDTLDTFDYLITNLSRDASPWILQDPYRKYDGVEILFNKRFSNRWQLLASYVYGRTMGTIDNGFADDIGWGGNTFDPNFWINADGHSTSDPTHMIKLQGTYVIPWIDVSVNGYFRGITGDAWTAQYRTGLNQGRVTFFTEPRGSNHYPMETILDMRLEKIFTFAGRYRLGLLFDVFNVFNTDMITSWGTRYGVDWFPGDSPSTDGHDLFGIVRPRQARLGIRLIF